MKSCCALIRSDDFNYAFGRFDSKHDAMPQTTVMPAGQPQRRRTARRTRCLDAQAPTNGTISANAPPAPRLISHAPAHGQSDAGRDRAPSQGLRRCRVGDMGYEASRPLRTVRDQRQQRQRPAATRQPRKTDRTSAHCAPARTSADCRSRNTSRSIKSRQSPTLKSIRRCRQYHQQADCRDGRVAIIFCMRVGTLAKRTNGQREP